MTFVLEEEVFPTVDPSDLLVEKEVNDSIEVVEEKQNGKRRRTESTDDNKTAEKKVGIPFSTAYVYCRLTYIV